MNRKKCCRCKKSKLYDKFHKNKRNRDGYSYQCKACTAAWNQSERGKLSMRRNDLWTTYGLTIENYNKMQTDQNDSCKICNVHKDQLSKRLFVDHCHSTGKVRGLLCHNCNIGVHHFERFKDNLHKVYQYLASEERVKELE